MERKFLEGLGLEKEAIDKIMTENGKDIEKQKLLTSAAETVRDEYKQQLDDVSSKLKAFDGVDVEKLKGEIETLKTDMKAKEANYALQIADRDFISALTAEIQAVKGKNPKAITALLDIDALKASKNQKEDTTAAIKALLESDSYLFDETQATTPAKVATGAKHTESGSTSADPFVAAAMKGAGLATGKEE